MNAAVQWLIYQVINYITSIRGRQIYFMIPDNIPQ